MYIIYNIHNILCILYIIYILHTLYITLYILPPTLRSSPKNLFPPDKPTSSADLKLVCPNQFHSLLVPQDSPKGVLEAKVAQQWIQGACAFQAIPGKKKS